ncbi:MAG: YrzE family protein [Burkholderiales bacterium]|nr:YrzE family protein [Burkholderiales bacterium]
MNDDRREKGDRPGRPSSLSGSVRAVGLGLISDIVATLAASIVLTGVVGRQLAGGNASVEDIEKTLLASDAYILLALAVGLASTVLGGYVAARVAGEREYLHGLLTGIAVLVFGEIMLAQSPATYPLGYRVIGVLLTVPAALYGAHLRKRARRAA